MSSPAQGMSMRRGLKIVLIAQAVVAGLLVLSDIDARWIPRLTDPTPLPTGPVSPGDQVRRYDPSRIEPGYTPPGTLPDLNLPEDMPDRLAFEVRAFDGEDYLFITGGISPGDAERLEAYIASVDALADPVAFHSPGGVVDEALAIGRMLREAEARTAILPGMACVSACPYMFAGGTERVVSLRGAIGLHQHYYETPGLLPAFLAVEQVQMGQGRTMEHLIDMGIDPGVMLHSLTTPPDDIYVLVEDELRDSRMATEVID